jgi:hypothetical protein
LRGFSCEVLMDAGCVYVCVRARACVCVCMHVCACRNSDRAVLIVIKRECTTLQVTLCNFLQPPTISSLLRTLFSNDLPLVSETKFHTHTKLQAKLVLYILIFPFLCSRREDKGSELNVSKHYQNLICSFFLHKSNLYLLLSLQNI